jgi:hypothetical protein
VCGREVRRNGGGGGAEEVEEEEQRDLVQRRAVLIVGCRGRIERRVPLFRKCSVTQGKLVICPLSILGALAGVGIAVP